MHPPFPLAGAPAHGRAPVGHGRQGGDVTPTQFVGAASDCRPRPTHSAQTHWRSYARCSIPPARALAAPISFYAFYTETCLEPHGCRGRSPHVDRPRTTPKTLLYRRCRRPLSALPQRSGNITTMASAENKI